MLIENILKGDTKEQMLQEGAAEGQTDWSCHLRLLLTQPQLSAWLLVSASKELLLSKTHFERAKVGSEGMLSALCALRRCRRWNRATEWEEVAAAPNGPGSLFPAARTLCRCSALPGHEEPRLVAS